MMKPTFFLLFALLCSSVSAQPFTQPAPAVGVPSEAALTSAKTSVSNGILTIELKAKGGEFTAWTHVFIDLGASAKPSYIHSSGNPASTSLELLFEGAQVYRFSGESPSVWSWTPLPGVTVERTISGDTLTLKTPLAPLRLPSGGTVKFFASTYTGDYADTLDTIPRDTRSWNFTVPKHNPATP
jgi:hypothetical protein